MISPLYPDWPAPQRVHAFTTTRSSGVSTGVFASFNLGKACGDDLAAVSENRRLFGHLLPSEPGWIRQVHGNRVVRREGFTEARPEADAVCSFTPHRACTILSADCLPILLCDRAATRVAVAHAGWRGLAAGVLEATVAEMETDPDELVAWLGPGISARAYEVGKDLRSTFLAAYPGSGHAFILRNDCLFADLYVIARHLLGRIGVSKISGGGFCTYTESERFFSHRRDGPTGRMATTIWLD